MRRTRTIVVAGAGLAGLTAALAIAREHFRVVLLERAASLEEIGAGIQITPNAGHVFARLGLEDALAEIATEPRAIEVRAAQSGATLALLPLGESFRRRYGLPYRLVHRGELQGILAAAAREHGEIELKTGTRLAEFAAHANGVTVMAVSDRAEAEYRGAALIAADGLRSMVRPFVPGASAVKPLGRTAWRATISVDDAPPEFVGSPGTELEFAL